jgi:type II secretory pathway pseudopilin PulG
MDNLQKKSFLYYIVIVILLCSILGGVAYWKLAARQDADDAAAVAANAAAEALAASEADAALGESCSVKMCESPLVCDEYSMTCGHAPVVPVIPTCNTTACNDFMRDLVVNKNKPFTTNETTGVCVRCPRREYARMKLFGKTYSIITADGIATNMTANSREERFNKIKH